MRQKKCTKQRTRRMEQECTKNLTHRCTLKTGQTWKHTKNETNTEMHQKQSMHEGASQTGQKEKCTEKYVQKYQKMQYLKAG